MISYKPFFFPCTTTTILENSHQKNDCTAYDLIEPLDSNEYQVKKCELVKNLSGKYALKHIETQVHHVNEEEEVVSVEDEVDEIAIPSIDGWPASAKREDEYWCLLELYPGGTLERSSAYVRNLLNDKNLNAPSTSVSLETKYDEILPLPNQVILDLRRRDTITINGEAIYKITSNDASEKFINSWSDAEKAKYTFKECMNALHNNAQLTTNALKLSTQASLARIAMLIMMRFQNQNLEDPKLILCGTQRVVVDTREHVITRIFYHSYWGVVSMSNPTAPPIKHIKGSVEFIIGTGELGKGKAGKAVYHERCSKFFDQFDDVEQCGEWPADSDTTEIYDKRMELFPDYYERIHPLYCEPVLEHLIAKKLIPSDQVIDSALQSKYLPLKEITLNNFNIYQKDSYVSKLPEQGKFITQRIGKILKDDSIAINRLASLFSLAIGEVVVKTAYLRFCKPSLNRHVTCSNYRIHIDTSDDEKFVIEASSLWCTRDMSKDTLPQTGAFSLDIKATIRKTELHSKEPKEIELLLYINKQSNSLSIRNSI